ncbi:MgtC/SapB family protein [Flavihumibacter solisilvae]|uniref:Membrane protein n=1 Tax=Flavihumibacter solisilvae TaxID=1349421 RepID=A0A0C1L487_9BACT|nr:MgtC/SapB family protein [Flavihumibacter solisilvae]KIC94912.1 membrane protein [Flavihumibacter solisilvae]
MENNVFLLLGISLGLGLLVGMQREYSNSRIAGIRTFPLITLTGTICGLLADELGILAIAAGLAGIVAMMIMANLQKTGQEKEMSGMTTEVAAILMYSVGAYMVFGPLPVALVVTGVVAVLLHAKPELHGLVSKLGAKDQRAIMQFVLISLVILPVLPDKSYDRFDVLNPRDIWLMVVLIVGISLTGYFIYKIYGEKAGALLGGILGGLISSTATTVSFARRARGAEQTVRLAAFVILTASAVSVIRVLIEIGIVAPQSFRVMVFPIGAELLVMIILTVLLFIRNAKEKSELPEQQNPAELKSALVFGILYAAISFASAWVKAQFGQGALFVVAIVSGLTDMDAITLSTAKMAENKSIDTTLGWKLILIAALSNMVFKGAMATVLGGWKLGRQVCLLFGIALAAGIAILLVWQ